jgi:hypothetical protein
VLSAGGCLALTVVVALATNINSDGSFNRKGAALDVIFALVGYRGGSAWEKLVERVEKKAVSKGVKPAITSLAVT